MQCVLDFVSAYQSRMPVASNQISCQGFLCSCTCFQVPDVMTTSQGQPIDSKTSTLTVGEKGPVAMQDFVFTDEMAHFDRERIPERVVHAKGAGVCVCVCGGGGS